MSDYSEDEMEAEQRDMEYAQEIAEHTNAWRLSEAQDQLWWNLKDVWGKTLPDGRTRKAWESSSETFQQVFHTQTLFRELGVRGYGDLKVDHDTWLSLVESAQQYADMYKTHFEPTMCAMARWYLK